MSNPFEVLEQRLSTIENLLIGLTSNSQKQESKKESEGFLTIQEASEFLNLKRATLYTKVHKNEIPFMKKGNRLYFSKSELISYIKEGRNTTYKEVEQAANDYLSNKANIKK